MRQPTKELETKLRRIRFVLMDIDGTLLTSSRATFDNVSAQLRRLKRLNVRFSVATGRTIAGARPVLERLHETVGMRMPPAISYNGAVLLSPRDGSLIERHLLSPELVATAVRACRACGLWPLVYACHDTVSGPPTETVYLDTAAPGAAEFNGMGTRRFADVGALEDDIVAILADAGDSVASSAIAHKLAVQLGGRLRASTSGSKYVEICSPDASKLEGMRRLAALHHVEVGEVMAIGDNLNDLEMIQAAGVGVAVGNAPSEVKAVADYACSLDSAQGVVEALRMLVRVHLLKANTRIRSNHCTPKRTPRGPQLTSSPTTF